MSDIGSNTYTRGRLYLNSSATSRIDHRYDQDWFRIHLDAGQRVRFDLAGSPTNRGTLRDTYLRGIYNSFGSYIWGTANDDGGTGLNSRVTFTASSTGYYYVAAGAYGSRTGKRDIQGFSKMKVAHSLFLLLVVLTLASCSDPNAERRQYLLTEMKQLENNYFVYFPLGFRNESNFKGALLMQDHASLV